MTDERPNVVLVHSHDLGRHVGSYGRSVDTPNLDALAGEGAVFENHFVTAPQCSPSRGSLHTGCYPHVNGLMGLAHHHWELDDDVPAMPELLADAGYETHLFGLQHVTEDPRSVGFQHDHTTWRVKPSAAALLADTRARTVADTVETFLEADAYAEPFFASVGFFEAHRIDVDGLFRFDDGSYDPPDPEDVDCPPFLPDGPGVREDLAELEGMVAAIDDAVGRIVDALDDSGLRDDTLVLFTTEHGIAFPRAKGSCYDGGIEAALVARLPGVVDAGRRYDELVSNVDVLPTVLDLVDVTHPGDVDGRSFLPLLTDQKYLPREQVFSELTWHGRYNPIRAVRTDQYKYVRNFWHLPTVTLTTDVFVSRAGREVREQYYSADRPYEELYDLESDPTESTNLAGEAAYESVRAELEERLVAWMRRTDDPLLDGPVPPADMETIEPW
ncbi:sulfatase family protein [Halobacterium jilantaiense]|uniref:Arylsulfatase A n=1 Tax=Halobacterium jilantaiense TaxID=355548 RepID=A0A1I0QJK1_9EURY|nr:sulfatase [Halobacterium jilantaiense]SEW27373.1 Arylsulfatase A [Halobacterium jilantaiense]